MAMALEVFALCSAKRAKTSSALYSLIKGEIQRFLYHWLHYY
jgi:hypothetical protein